MKPHRVLASLLAGSAVVSPLLAHAKPPKPSIHKQAEAARKACAPYAGDIAKAEKAKGLRRHTLTGLLYTESRCKPKAHNRKTNARGMGQHVPSGAAAVGRIQRASGQPAPWFKHADAFDARKSIYAAADLLAWSIELCGGLAEALVAYNRGKCGKPSVFARAVLSLAAAIRAIASEEPTT